MSVRSVAVDMRCRIVQLSTWRLKYNYSPSHVVSATLLKQGTTTVFHTPKIFSDHFPDEYMTSSPPFCRGKNQQRGGCKGLGAPYYPSDDQRSIGLPRTSPLSWLYTGCPVTARVVDGPAPAPLPGDECIIWIRELCTKLISMTISSATTCWDVKEHMQRVTGVPTTEQRIVCNGRQAEDDQEIKGVFGLGEESLVYMSLRLRGC